MKRNLLPSLVCLGFLLALQSSSAQTTIILPLSQDAYLNSSAPSSNFGTVDFITSGSVDPDAAIFRSALQVDLSSVPSEATISSAILYLNLHEDFESQDCYDYVLQRFQSSWSETGITYANQPEVYDTKIEFMEEENDWYKFDVIDNVIDMFQGSYSNYGWLLREYDETTPDCQEYYYSREYSQTVNQPYIEITYVTPLKVEDALIVHTEDSLSNTGSITPIISGGMGNYTYDWIDGSSGLSISSAASLSNLSHGWYGLHLSDITTNEELYLAFIIGSQSGEVTIDFKPGPDYIDDALFYDLVRNGIDYGENNFGNTTVLLAENWTYGSWYDVKSLIKFSLWMDPVFSVNQADLHLYGNSHNPLSRPNTSELRKVIEPWLENEVTYNTQPSIASTPIEVLSATPQGDENKVIDMSSFWNEWMLDNTENYGVMFQLQSYNDQYTSMKYYSSDEPNSTNRPWMQFKLVPSLYTTWDDSTQTGVIQVDISSLSSTGPYHYQISNDSIPDLGSVYQYLSDSVSTPIDSVSFFRGYYTSTSHTFSGYDAGKYFISVFDSQKNRILDKEVYLQSPLQFDAQTGIVSDHHIISTDSVEAFGSLALYTSESVEGSFEVEISRGNDLEQFIGLVSHEVSVKDFRDLAFGVQIEGDKLFVVNNGVLITGDTFDIPLGLSSLIFELKSGDLFIKNLSGDQLLNVELPIIYGYKVGLGTTSNATMSIKTLKGFTLKSIPTINVNVTPGSCFSSNGTIEVNYSVSGLFASYYQFNPPTITNFSTNVTSTMSLVDPGIYGASNLSPGIYVINPNAFFLAPNISINVPFSPQVVQVNSKLVWENMIETAYSPLGNFPQSESLSRSNNSSGEILGSAQTKHELNTIVENEVFFNLNLPNSWDNCILRWTDVIDQAGNIYSGVSQEPFEGIIFVHGANEIFVGKLVNGVMQGVLGPQTPFAPVSNSASLGYYYNTSTGTARLEEYAANNTVNLVPSYPIGGSATHLSVNPGNLGTGIYSALTNMPCIVPDIYAKVERKLRGVKYRVYENILRFYVDEEYNSAGSLRYRIFSEHDRVTPEQDWTQVPTPNISYGDNRFLLDVGVNGGIYILEVENEKKERFYLRFEN